MITIQWRQQERNDTNHSNVQLYPLMTSLAYGVDGAQAQFHTFEITRRPVGDLDVKLDIIYSGICHTDIHMTRNEFNMSIYPLVPGHEIFGKVIAIGTKVLKASSFSLLGHQIQSWRSCWNWLHGRFM